MELSSERHDATFFLSYYFQVQDKNGRKKVARVTIIDGGCRVGDEDGQSRVGDGDDDNGGQGCKENGLCENHVCSG